MNGKNLLNCWVLGSWRLSKLNMSDMIPSDGILQMATDRLISKWSATPPTRFCCLILLYYTQGSQSCYYIYIIILYLSTCMANSSHLGFWVKMVSKLFTNVYNGNQMSAFEENDTSFVFLSHWVPAMINLNIFQNGGWRPSWIYALHGHSRRQLLVRIVSLTPKTYVLTPISTL